MIRTAAKRHAKLPRSAEKIERQSDADEFGDDGQGVEQKQVDDAEGAPELAEPLQDQPRMADARDGAESQHHLLVDVKYGDQQQQRPQQRRAVVLAGLGIGPESAGVIVADHDDETRTENGQKCLEPVLPACAGAVVSLLDGAEGALDMAEMGGVENSALRRCLHVGVHWLVS